MVAPPSFYGNKPTTLDLLGLGIGASGASTAGFLALFTSNIGVGPLNRATHLAFSPSAPLLDVLSSPPSASPSVFASPPSSRTCHILFLPRLFKVCVAVGPLSSYHLGWMSGRKHGGGRHGRPRRHEVLLPDEILAQEEGFGQSNVAKPVGQQAMGTLAREMARALKESMDILKAENQVQA
ncbi:hypothetical protein HYC85_028638 [Camellia sinensis]|uniref:Uncharacterized protein n=1 Tax=Camellia sinensis TaxID=4442 RepID=A0A7J7FWG0_CAMSI|nr:hypothetical protein HYC85_028638 [Camellia sinensis]